MAFESVIEGSWTGWNGSTIVKLTNGQVWEQAQYLYEYRYAYRPKVTLFANGYSGEMLVHGMSRAVRVRRLV